MTIVVPRSSGGFPSVLSDLYSWSFHPFSSPFHRSASDPVRLPDGSGDGSVVGRGSGTSRISSVPRYPPTAPEPSSTTSGGHPRSGNPRTSPGPRRFRHWSGTSGTGRGREGTKFRSRRQARIHTLFRSVRCPDHTAAQDTAHPDSHRIGSDSGTASQTVAVSLKFCGKNRIIGGRGFSEEIRY